MNCFDTYDKIPTKNSYAYIFCNVNFNNIETRKASTHDKDLLKEALTKLGFPDNNIIEYTDMSAHEIQQKFADILNNGDIDCVVCAILTYNLTGNLLCTFDGPIWLDELLSCHTDDQVQSLKGKPKLIFVVTSPWRDDNAIEKCDADFFGFEEEHTIPRTADMLVVCSSTEDSTRSSYFMQILKRILEECGNTYDIMTILVAVSNCIKTESNDQIPYIMSTLRKQLKFAPNTNEI